MKPSNTVMGIPERAFCSIWTSKLWQAMAKTGKGYPKPSTRHTGIGKDRRADKLEAAERAKLTPIFSGKLNYRRSERAA